MERKSVADLCAIVAYFFVVPFDGIQSERATGSAAFTGWCAIRTGVKTSSNNCERAGEYHDNPQLRIAMVATVALFIEYEAVLARPEHLAAAGITVAEAENILDVLASVAEPVEPHFLWRPRLRDADDDMVLEAAVNGQAEAIATFNARDFGGVAEEFGIELLTPSEILKRM